MTRAGQIYSQKVQGRRPVRILVIDDEADLLALMSEHLIDEGFEVECARNGRTGLNLADSFRPDIVVTDIFMPEVDGIEVIRTFARHYPNTNVIATSDGGSMRYRQLLEQAQKLGAVSSIEKPFSLASFLSLVRSVAGNCRG